MGEIKRRSNPVQPRENGPIKAVVLMTKTGRINDGMDAFTAVVGKYRKFEKEGDSRRDETMHGEKQ